MSEFAMCVACVARSVDTELYASCFLITGDCSLTAIMQNGPRLRGTNLL